MLLRAILLLAMSSAAWGAGVTIELDTQLSIEEIEYTPPASIEDTSLLPMEDEANNLTSSIEDDVIFIDTSWEEEELNDTGLDTLKFLRLSHSNTSMGIIIESVDSTEASLHGLYANGHLNAVTINPDGSQYVKAYPNVENGFNSFGIRNGVLYLVDMDSDTIFEWNVDYWDDIKVSHDLPSGHYYSVTPYSMGYIIATADKTEGEPVPNAPTELWDAGDTISTQRLPIVGQVSNVKYINTHDRTLQIFSEDLISYTGRWLDNDEPDFKINVNSVDLPHVHSAKTNTGTFIMFYGDVLSTAFWLQSAPMSVKAVKFPQNLKSFSGCTSVNNQAFCMFNVEGLGYALYEMVDGEFVLDTQLNEAFSGKHINGIYAVGEKRYISAFYDGVTGSRSYLYLADSEGVKRLYSHEVANSQSQFFIKPSILEGTFYWISQVLGETLIYKAEASGDFTFKRNLDSIVPIESPAEESSGGGSGSMPTYLLAMLLMLLFPRVRWRQVSGV